MLKKIEEAVSKYTNVDIKDIYGKRRKSNYVFARRCICVYAYKFAKLNKKTIAKILSLDHSTVVYHISEFEYDIAYDANRRAIAKQIENEIQKYRITRRQDR